MSKGIREAESFYFAGPQALKLHGQAWTSAGATRCLVGVHGYSEHSGCYEHFARFLNELNCDVYWMDLPGHGRSEGRRSDISRFEYYVESLRLFLEEVQRRSRLNPEFLFAHSLGALTSIRLLQAYPNFSHLRVALSSPLLGLARESFHGIGRFLQNSCGLRTLELLTKILPNFSLSNKKDLTGSILTHDPAMQLRRNQDPLIKPIVTINWTREFLRARRLAFRDVDLIQNPIGIFQAGEDLIVSRKETERFFHLLGSPEKKLKIYEGFWHEIVNETERDLVFQDLQDWFGLCADSRAHGSI